MDRFLIKGGKALRGTVAISGAKNSALPAMAAALLTEEELALHNIPKVRDLITMSKLLAFMGARVSVTEMPASDYVLAAPALNHAEAPYELVKTMRASILTLGPLMARTGVARVSLPGGCAIGARPVDLHLAALEKMGAEIATEHGYIQARAPKGGQLKGAHIVFEKITVTGTENILMAGAITGGDLTITHCAPEHLGAVIAKLRQAGVRIDEVDTTTIRVRSAKKLVAADVTTEEYPGFATDMQAQYMALATQAEGTSVITETIFENRYLHASEMVRMGANISVDGRKAVVRGPARLSGTTVQASDLRASAGLVLAGLVASSETIIDRVYHIDRGYEGIVEKLRSVGADMERLHA